MERHFEVKVGVGVDVTTSRGDSKVLGELGLIPLEVSLNISEVAHLQILSESTVLDDLTEGENLVHDL